MKAYLSVGASANCCEDFVADRLKRPAVVVAVDAARFDDPDTAHDVVAALLKAGADVTQEDGDGRSAQTAAGQSLALAERTKVAIAEAAGRGADRGTSDSVQVPPAAVGVQRAAGESAPEAEAKDEAEADGGAASAGPASAGAKGPPRTPAGIQVTAADVRQLSVPQSVPRAGATPLAPARHSPATPSTAAAQAQSPLQRHGTSACRAGEVPRAPSTPFVQRHASGVLPRGRRRPGQTVCVSAQVAIMAFVVVAAVIVALLHAQWHAAVPAGGGDGGVLAAPSVGPGRVAKAAAFQAAVPATAPSSTFTPDDGLAHGSRRSNGAQPHGTVVLPSMPPDAASMFSWLPGLVIDPTADDSDVNVGDSDVNVGDSDVNVGDSDVAG